MTLFIVSILLYLELIDWHSPCTLQISVSVNTSFLRSMAGCCLSSMNELIAGINALVEARPYAPSSLPSIFYPGCPWHIHWASKCNLLNNCTPIGIYLTTVHPPHRYVPFRDSKLTHLLRESLGGNTKSTLIVRSPPPPPPLPAEAVVTRGCPLPKPILDAPSVSIGHPSSIYDVGTLSHLTDIDHTVLLVRALSHSGVDDSRV